MDFMRWYWLALIVFGFGVPEAVAIMRRRIDDTFSASWWTWLGTFSHGAHAYRTERRIAAGAFFLSLYLHFAFGVRAWPWLIGPAVPLGAVVALSVARKET